ncbi:DUF4956 domain-containing protein [Clostridium botulinum]|uniref:Membrane protein n=1 Tax=Clostridium botulinum (strain Eklund 17B / Type B) TaxID=935198 RepID=B2THU9_CLOBB|nr:MULTISPECIES: DUF4956 domain-containing protein [Clostridium]ACD21909.1 putative membrane protein [Clostridium botulinum B str. Eklund 17B (NRP)]AIY79768.1 putative membrane protein [Clostridium botulinum 202F]KAI3345297.1 DUF4956 domain-containing protein [Clostridium botulinum]SJT59910.1 putative Mg(2+) transport ATPase [Clostridioides difficile]KFX57797.1 membrane protein [Clostridium botulinum]
MTQTTTNFSDIFKSSFAEKLTQVSFLDMFIALALAFVIGLFIMQVYKKTFKGVMYSESFAISLLALSLITTLIILAVTSNVVLSLGMVGALSIVRFRSAIKEPIDIAFLFWSISVGIVIGAGLIPLAVLGSIFIGIVMVLFINKKTSNNPYILVINCEDDDSENTALKVLSKNVDKYNVKSKTISPMNGIEMTVEIGLKKKSTDFVNSISKLNGISNVVLVSYNGDYMS